MIKRSLLINQLRQLRRINPDDATLDSIKNKVYLATGIYPQKTPWWSGVFVRYSLATLSLFIVFVGILYFRYTSNPMYLANLQVSRASGTIHANPNPQSIISEIPNLEASHRQLASLNLNGLPGVYTQAECQAIYLKYEEYLNFYLNLAKSSPSPSSDTIIKKIESYQLEVEQRWPHQ